MPQFLVRVLALGSFLLLPGLGAAEVGSTDAVATSQAGLVTNSGLGPAPPEFSKSISPDLFEVTTGSLLTFTIDNSRNLTEVTNLSFTDTMPIGLRVDNPGGVVNGCGGTVTAVPNSNVVTLTGGTTAAGTICLVTVNTFGGLPGEFLNVTGELTSSLGNSGTASAPFVITAGIEGSAAFDPLGLGVGEVSVLTIDLDNSFNAVDATDVELIEDLPAGMVVADPANLVNSCGDTVTAVPGSGVISFTGGTLAAGTRCSFSLDVEGTAPGELRLGPGSITSSVGLGSLSQALLAVWEPATFSKTFDPAAVGVAGISTLRFTIDNLSNGVEAAYLNFTDNLPTGMEVADPANVVNDCGGTVGATAGSTVVSLVAGLVSSRDQCSFSVDVVATAAGELENVSGDLTSSVGNSGPAVATLSVNQTPGLTKAFSPEQIQPGGVSTLTFTIDHTAGTADATGLAFIDNLPAGMEVADPANRVDTCLGGTTTANPGEPTITYAGGTVSAGTVCTLSVDVTITEPGQFMNVAEPLVSVFGTGPTGSAVAVLGSGSLVDVPTAFSGGLMTLIGALALLAVATMRRRH